MQNNRHQSSVFNRIATDLHDPAAIVEAVQDTRQKQRKVETLFVATRTPTEQRLAQIWAEFIGVDLIGIHDDFFELGGHSILATQILSRVNKVFQVEIPVGVLFTMPFTVAELAKAIDEYQIEQANPEEITAILEELEGLSDNEIKKLLSNIGGEEDLL